MKRLFMMLTLVCVSSAVFAQGSVRFGFTASPGISWYSADSRDINSKGTRFSFNYGAIVDYIIDNNERYTLTTGLTIDMNGGKLVGYPSTTETGFQSSLVAKTQYLEIPLGLKLRSNETASNLTFYGTLGLVNGFRIRSRGNYSYTDGQTSISESNVKIKNLPFHPNTIQKISPYHLALHFEGGAEFRVSENTSLVAGIYFRNGFTNVIDDNDKERIVARGLGLRIAAMF